MLNVNCVTENSNFPTGWNACSLCFQNNVINSEKITPALLCDATAECKCTIVYEIKVIADCSL